MYGPVKHLWLRLCPTIKSFVEYKSSFYMFLWKLHPDPLQCPYFHISQQCPRQTWDPLQRVVLPSIKTKWNLDPVLKTKKSLSHHWHILKFKDIFKIFNSHGMKPKYNPLIILKLNKSLATFTKRSSYRIMLCIMQTNFFCTLRAEMHRAVVLLKKGSYLHVNALYSPHFSWNVKSYQKWNPLLSCKMSHYSKEPTRKIGW